jgi:hypothetical protein
MRAGFLGQNICALGFGIATLQAPRLVMDEPVREPLAPPPANESTPQPEEGEKKTFHPQPL